MSTATMPASRPALTAKGAATRARIVEAAAALVRQRGAARTSIDEVRADAQVSASQLYHYFSDKNELMRAVVAHEAVVAVEQQPQLAALDSIESLRAWRDAVVDRAGERQFRGWSPLGSLASELVDTDPDARAGLVDGFGLWLAPVRSGLVAMRASGALRSDADPDSLAIGLLAALQGGLLVSRVQEETAPLEAALDAAIARVASFAPQEPSVAASAAPAIRRTPASPARASGAMSAPRTPLRPRRPLAR
ncbi:helix-turn-helix domain containing protein [Agreia sp. PsM10]|uniref:TetR/AcrR family transcriptional regulator n=1 Tax=Agreia sp. PsM10 TaxID=3030533 RepID=UPI00263A8E07|nr:TetR/AcrR family transcriptional regulator [Agreia sp. PsM10]MDN4640660.1 helix-turn-helix domain containing protein [Agreia sp. PsM10]